ncbi:MAG TPA: TIGR00269 family protein [Thermoplasmata archaeon]|nr:TIGR00269 family protein [Thermoplasmata archaeon]
MKCSKCQRKAVIFVRYGGYHLCSHHFTESVLKRVKKELRNQFKLRKLKIAVGVSGGKDSLLTLYLLAEIFKNNPDVEIEAICVDEGIKGYRDKSIPFVEKMCKKVEVPFHLVSFRKMVGYELDTIAQIAEEKTPCSYCGVFRRLCLNRKSKEIGATYLAVGLNLDDVAQTIFMNFARADIKKLARLGPHKIKKEGLVPRILPLRQIPEQESFLFCVLKGIDFYHGECPYAYKAHRGLFRELLGRLEMNTPGTRHAFLRIYDTLYDSIIKKEPPASLKICEKCGEPSSGTVCKTCLFLEEVKKKF